MIGLLTDALTALMLEEKEDIGDSEKERFWATNFEFVKLKKWKEQDRVLWQSVRSPIFCC